MVEIMEMAVMIWEIVGIIIIYHLKKMKKKIIGNAKNL
jgi:hypothetical protein